MKKKLLIVMLLFTLVFSMVGCGSKEVTETDTNSNSSNEVKTNDTDSNDIDSKDTNSDDTEKSEDTQEDSSAADANPAVAIENAILLDKDGFKVTSLSIGDDGYGDQEVKFDIENNSDQNVTFQIMDVSINNIMYYPLFSTDVTAGNKASDSLLFYSSELKKYGIDEIATIELKWLVLDAETMGTIVESETVSLKTASAENYVQTYDDSGVIIYDDKDIKIVAQSLYADEIMGEEIIFYVENNSDTKITVSNLNVALNGIMVDSLLYCEVVPGKKSVSSMSFYTLEENGITNITDAEVSLNIMDTDTYESIADTDTAKLTFK